MYDIFRVDLSCANCPKFVRCGAWVLIIMVEEESHHHVHFSEEVTRHCSRDGGEVDGSVHDKGRHLKEEVTEKGC